MSLLKRIESAGAAAAKPSGVFSVPPVPDAPPDGPLNGGPSSIGPSSIMTPAPPGQRTFGSPLISPAKDRALQINRDLKGRVKQKLIAELDPTMDLTQKGEVLQRLQTLFDGIVENEAVILTR